MNRRLFLLATMLVPLLSASPLAGQATIGGDWRAELRAFAERVVEAGLAPGMGVAVTVGDWVAYADGVGAADLGTGRGVTADTPFYIASTTKSLTATAAAIAAHRGDLDFKLPMTHYLPDAQLPEDVPRDRIKVHDLVALTHGLDGGGPIVLRTAYTGQWTREQLLDLLRYHKPTGEYGVFDYNNLGFNLAGLVLESVYGESWKDVVDRLVLEPTGMVPTTAYVSRIPPGRMARPHEFTPDGFAPIQLGKDDSNMHAAGGHFASARDLARYLAVHVTGGIVEGERVMPAEPLLRTHDQQVAQDRNFGPFHRHGWGYGWDLGTYGADTLIHRFGSFSGYRSHVSFMPQHDIGVVVLVNGDGAASPASDLVATYAYELLLGEPDVATRFAARLDSLAARAAEARRDLAEQLAERRARLAPLPHPLSSYTGTYENAELGRMEWRAVAGGLEMRMGVVRSRAEGYDAARNQLRIEVGGGVVAEFVFPEGGGPASALRLRGAEFARVE